MRGSRKSPNRKEVEMTTADHWRETAIALDNRLTEALDVVEELLDIAERLGEREDPPFELWLDVRDRGRRLLVNRDFDSLVQDKCRDA
jgi:hypothetical protein